MKFIIYEMIAENNVYRERERAREKEKKRGRKRKTKRERVGKERDRDERESRILPEKLIPTFPFE